VTRVAEALEREGAARVRWVRVEESGTIDLEDLARALEEGGARLVAVQAVNHETGVVQPVHEAMTLAARHGARVHVDAVQAWGRIDVELRAADTLSLAAHKLRGPKGIGALVTRPGMRIEPILRGGSQERGIRPGTVDPVAAAGLAVAARHAKGGPARYREVAELRDRLEREIRGLVPEALVNGRGARAPHVTNVYFPGWDGAELVAALDLEGVFVSSGSACSAGTNEPSPVLTAMLGAERAAGSVRFSLGETTTEADVEAAVSALARVMGRR
jgi:cysteine desulfurase